MVNELKRAIERGNIVVVAGTGVSIIACRNQKVDGFEVASWSGLLRHGVMYCRDKERVIDPDDARLLDDQINSGKVKFLISAGELITQVLKEKSAGVYHRWLKESVGKLHPTNPAVLDALHSLGGVLVTLNYDTLFTQYLHLTPITWQQRDRVEEVLQGERDNVVLHLHGYYEEPQSVILGIQSYEKVKTDPHTATVMHLFTLAQTLIFVGCRGTVGDPNFKNLLDWGYEALKDSTHRHFIICREAELVEISEELKKNRVSWLYPISYGNNFDDLVPFLKSLAPPGGGVYPIDGVSKREKPDFDLSKYAKAFKTKYARVKLDSVETNGSAYRELTLRQVFIPQDVRECQQYLPQVLELPKEHLDKLLKRGDADADTADIDEIDEKRKRYLEQPPQSVLDLIDNRDHKRLVILGDPGSGKSCLLQHWALKWCDLPPVERQEEPIPLLIELRLYALAVERKTCRNFDEFISEGRGVPCSFEMEALRKGLTEGRFCVCFDALDEVFDPGLRETTVGEILRFTNDYPAVRVIMTSRVFGYKGEAFRDASFSHVMLQDFDDEQIARFLEGWHQHTYELAEDDLRETKHEQISRAIRESHTIRQLAGNPLLLTMMAILNRHRDLPRDRAELYQECTKLLLQQWKVDDALRASPDLSLDAGAIGLKEKEAILCALARAMQEPTDGTEPSTALVNLISRQQLEKVIEVEVKEIVRGNPKAVARALIEQLRLRNFILCFVGGESYAFIHRTFLEYYRAKELQQQFESEKRISIEQLKNDIVGRYFREETWEEVLCLMAGMLAPRFVGELIGFLLKQKDPEQDCRHVFLAARFIGEVRRRHVISEYVERAKGYLKRMALFKFHTLDLIDNTRVQTIQQKTIQEIARLWKDNQEMLPWLKQRAQDNDNMDVQKVAISELAHWWNDNAEIFILLKMIAQTGDSAAARLAAVEGLTQNWKYDINIFQFLKICIENDKHWPFRAEAIKILTRTWKENVDLFSWLKFIALNDKNSAIRNVAINELATGWKCNAEIYTLLKESIEKDENRSVRGEALHWLAKQWKDNPEVYQLVKSCALNSEYFSIRETAIRQLCYYWKKDPETVTIVRSCLKNDSHPVVRRSVLRMLAIHWQNDPDILPSLKKYANEDENKEVRQISIELLARYWKNDADVKTILIDRAQNDVDQYVRQTAIQLLAKSWKNNQDVVEIVRRCAESDKNSQVWWAALKELIPWWKDKPEINTFVRQHSKYDKYSNVRRTAIIELARVWKNTPETWLFILSLVQNENDYNVRFAGEELLTRKFRGNYERFALLKKYALVDKNIEIRRAAVYELAFGLIYDPDILPIFKTYAQTDEDSSIRKAAVQAIVHLGKDDPGTLAIVKTLAKKDKDGSVRCEAIEGLSRYWNEDPDVLTIIKSSLETDIDGSVRQVAVQKLSRLGKDDPDVFAKILQCFNDKSSSLVRKTAVQALARNFRDRQETLLLIKLCIENDEDGSVRQAAVHELANYWKDDPETLPLIKKLAKNNSDNFTQKTAIEELSRFWKDDTETLSIIKSNAEEEKNKDVRYAAVEKLTALWQGDPETLSIIQSCAQGDTDCNIRILAIENLIRFWSDHPESLPIIKLCIENDKDGNVRRRALNALVSVWKDDPDAVKIIKTSARNDGEGIVRQFAVAALALIWKNDSDSLEIITNCARSDQDGAVRQSSVEALAIEWKDNPGTLELIRSHARSDKDSIVRRSAMRALISLWKDDPVTLEIFKECAQNDADNILRFSSIIDLQLCWRDDPDVQSFIELLEKTESKNNSTVRGDDG